MTTQWFEREFDFPVDTQEFNSLISRLRKTPRVLSELVFGIPSLIQILKTDNKWSVRENIGHLWVLEPLWQARFDEIRESAPIMSPADLSNAGTDSGSFNEESPAKLIADFSSERNKTLNMLERMSAEDLRKVSIHPRLNQPMGVTDLAYFVAEHDRHHLDTICDIVRRSGRSVPSIL